MNDAYDRHEIDACIREARAARNRVLGGHIRQALARLRHGLQELATTLAPSARPQRNGPTAGHA